MELDFSAHHPALLFMLSNCVPPESDIYSPPGLINQGYDRKLIKLAYGILLNSKANHAAILERELDKKDEIVTPFNFSGFIKQVKCSFPEGIKKYIGKSEGARLQFIDSLIAEKVMFEFACLGKPCLGIHDSFIVKKWMSCYCMRLWSLVLEMLLFLDDTIKGLCVLKTLWE